MQTDERYHVAYAVKRIIDECNSTFPIFWEIQNEAPGMRYSQVRVNAAVSLLLNLVLLSEGKRMSAMDMKMSIHFAASRHVLASS